MISITDYHICQSLYMLVQVSVYWHYNNLNVDVYQVKQLYK